MPHPAAFARELFHNPAQHQAGEYARTFQDEHAHRTLTPEELVHWLPVDGPERVRYLQALRRSDIGAMLHYYQRNYPRPPYPQTRAALPPIEVPVLIIHGLGDTAILPGGLNDTWHWVHAPLTIVTLPEAGHFVQHDNAEAVTTTMVTWLHATPARPADHP